MDVLARLVSTTREVGDTLQEVRYLYTREYEDDEGVKYLGKNRLGLLGRRVTNPTMDRIMNKWLAP